jgi:hypothetical protein
MTAFAKLAGLSSLVLALALGAAACTTGGDDADTSDGGPGGPDATMADAAPEGCHAEAQYTVATTIPAASSLAELSSDGTLSYTASLNADQDQVRVELYPGLGVFAGMTGFPAGTYQITGDELNYATCGLCVRMFADTQNGNIGAQYLATGGSVTITDVGTAVGQNFQVTVNAVPMETVTINNSTFMSTPVGDGCVSEVTFTTDTMITAAQ